MKAPWGFAFCVSKRQASSEWEQRCVLPLGKYYIREVIAEMTNKKTSRRALLTSVMALVLCMVMLVGTTFAWFTDSVTSGVNTIQSGNLDMELMYSTDMTEWKEVTSETPLFDDNALWEPGYTQVVYLKVVNKGTLALKYMTEFSHNYRVTRGKNVLGDYYYLGDYLKIGVAETDAKFDNREAAQAAIAGSEKSLTKGVQLTEGWTEVKAGEETKPFAVVLYMPTTVGNEANAKSKTWISKLFDIGLEVTATQATVESDSFDNTYDADAIETKFDRVEFTGGTHEVTGKIQATGEYGTIHVKGGTTTINADTVTAQEVGRFAMAVYAENNAKVVINSGVFGQQITGDSSQYDLIFADDNAVIEINGGTFKCATPQWTLNCKDGSNAQIIVKGGSFYQFDPSNANVGEGEIIVPDGYKVVQDGDWYTVTAA